MSRLSKILFIFSGLSLFTFAVGRGLLGDWIPFFWILLALAVGFAGLAIYFDRKFFAEFWSMKTTKHGMNMGVLILLVITLLGIVNFLGVRNSKTWDFSQAQRNTLSEQSVQILKSLQDDLKISYFYKKGVPENEENRRAFRELIKKYQDQTSKMKLDFFEVNEARAKAEEYGVTKGSGVVFLEYKGRKNRIEKVDEQEITQAIIKVTRDKNKTVYFSVGHQELDLEDGKEARGLNLFKLMIENNSYNVKTLNLNSQPTIPEDADVVMIVGPQQNFVDYEIKAVEEYLKKGGKVFLGLEPKRAPAFDKLLATFGIVPENNYIKSSFMGMGYIDGPAVANVFSPSFPATKVFFGKQEVVRMEWPMNLKIQTAPEGVQVEAILKTTDQASAFAEPKIPAKGIFPQGPFNLAVSVKGKFPKNAGQTKDFNLVVTGDAEFMSNYLLYQNLNRDLALNLVSALAGEDSLISIAPREVQKTELSMTSVKENLFLFGLIIPLPLIMLFSSFGLWLRRRAA